ncbi:hypothetical protein BDF14DRAFT_1770598 [Spinellus fusiger]|nr:hypothetical protein BDF14DRAFT_1770598 [Spinellus fusiger]
MLSAFDNDTSSLSLSAEVQNEDNASAYTVAIDPSCEDMAGDASPSIRKRTRATADQLAVLEDTFAVNVSPNSKLRKQLADQLQMSERSIQIWFQNRRAKVKHIQKRTQMKIHHASIRAQFYHQHQQSSLMPLQPQYYPHYTSSHLSMSRAQSVDAIGLCRQPSPVAALHFYSSSAPSISSQNHSYTPPPHTFQTYPTPALWSGSYESPMYRQSMPPQAFTNQVYGQRSADYDLSSPLVDFPELLNGPGSSSGHSPSGATQSSSNASAVSMPALVPVPNAGPTAMLAISQTAGHSASLPLSPKTSFGSSFDHWTMGDDMAHPNPLGSSNASMGTPSMSLSTIDPSNLIVGSVHSPPSSSTTIPPLEEVYFSAVTLTIGTWHRMKLNATDLMCVYSPDTRVFAWHISDNSCQFKMEIPLHAIATIDYTVCDILADIHVDITEPPLFYMENSQHEKAQTMPFDRMAPAVQSSWVQCSDFTEGKQASRLFRHTLKGVSQSIRQELMQLTLQHPDTRRLVRFNDTPPQSGSVMHSRPMVLPTAMSTVSPTDPASEGYLLSQPDTGSSATYWHPETMIHTPVPLREFLY